MNKITSTARLLMASVILFAILYAVFLIGSWASTQAGMTVLASILNWANGEMDKHEGVSILLFSAAIATMPTELFFPLSKVPALVWGWTWLYKLLHSFWGQKHPGSIETFSDKTRTPDGGTKEVKVETITENKEGPKT